jgi:cell division protein FtsI/penicillin-binding protein 2
MLTKISFYLNIFCVASLIFIVFLLKIYYDKSKSYENLIKTQENIIELYAKNREQQINAIKDRDNTILLLNQQYSDLMINLDNIEENDSVAKSWSSEEYSKFMVNEVLNMKIDINELRNIKKE